jgi:hypothetical protein
VSARIERWCLMLSGSLAQLPTRPTESEKPLAGSLVAALATEVASAAAKISAETLAQRLEQARFEMRSLVAVAR